MKAIIVSVDFADLLAITLPYNRHHFDKVMIVTSNSDLQTVKVAIDNDAEFYRTNAFYDNDAIFNKWKALEEGLDAFGRIGWLCLMDADILWPKKIPSFPMEMGKLYTPRRRMCPSYTERIPIEPEWQLFDLHRQQREFAGYSQIFNANDPHLGVPPWHQINWTHAGGADSFFQLKWPESAKIRPGFEVLHLGAAGTNWCGRAVDYIDGTQPPAAKEKMKLLRSLVNKRTRGPNRFDAEKIGGR